MSNICVEQQDFVFWLRRKQKFCDEKVLTNLGKLKGSSVAQQPSLLGHGALFPPVKQRLVARIHECVQ